MSEPRIQHGHLDTEANPSYESNVTIHSHANGDKRHRHDAPSWGAIGDQYVWPSRAEAIMKADRELLVAPALDAARAAPQADAGHGVRTDCPLEGVHEHSFRGAAYVR
jgi:hypothetical protein